MVDLSGSGLMIRLQVLVATVLVSSFPRAVLTATDSCNRDGELRFVRAIPGFGHCSTCEGGLLQLCDSLVWKAMCDSDWTAQDAAVACRTLGYTHGGAINISIDASVTDPSGNGVVCDGSENTIADCVRGDRAIDQGVCTKSIRLACQVSDSTNMETTTRMETQTAVESTTEHLTRGTETSPASHYPSTSPMTDAPRTSSSGATLSGTSQQNSFFGGTGLYIFIGAVGAVVLTIMILVQILLTCWCCYKFRTKGVSPSDAEKQGQVTKNGEPAMQIDGPMVGSTNISLVSQEHQQPQQSHILQHPQVHHLLQQSSPNSSLGPIYEPIGGDTSSMRSQDAHGLNRQVSRSQAATQDQQLVQPNGYYSELGKSEMYAQIAPHIARPQESPQPLHGESQYQVLQHKTSSLKRDTRPPVHAVNATALAVEQGVPECEVVALAYEAPIPRKGSIQTPPFKRAEAKQSANQHPVDICDNEANIYHIIEPPPPDYATLEGIDELDSTNTSCNNNQLRGRNNSSSSQDQRMRSSSKSSISPGPSVHSGSHSSLSSSSSSGHSPQINRVANSSSPLVSKVNNGPRVTNKYTESPVASKKDLIQQGSPNHPDLVRASDRNEMNTLV